MYESKIRDINTITWHNLHFILENYTNEILSTVEEIIAEGESGDRKNNKHTLLEIKSEVVATVKTLKAMHTVLTHHRMITKVIR